MTAWEDQPHSTCSKSCGPGYKMQYRFCLGEYCGDRETTRKIPCQVSICPHWGDWEFSSCSESCGNGFRSVTRKCYQSKNEVSSSLCQKLHGGNSERSSEHCLIKQCEMSGWINTSECSVTCGSGYINQKRHCRGNDCAGRETRRQDVCIRKECPPRIVTKDCGFINIKCWFD